MSNAVVIKGTTYGFSVYVDEQADFATICEQVKEKFKESAKFFGNANNQCKPFHFRRSRACNPNSCRAYLSQWGL